MEIRNQMRWIVLPLLVSSITARVLAATTNLPPKEFFVSTNGNDSWSGRLSSPNGGGSDGPFATLKRAIEAARGPGKTDETAYSSTNITIRQGTYFLDAPLTLTLADSGVKIAAYQKEKPIISGGRLVSGWKEEMVNDKKAWVTEISQVREGKWIFHELWVNGQRARPARRPNHGYLNVAEVPDATPQWQQGQTRFRFKEGDLKNWGTVTNGEVVVMSRWVESRLPIKAVDETQRMVSFSKKSVFQIDGNDPYYVENVLEALEEPGEWYLEHGSGKLYYLPREGETQESTEVIAPVLAQLLRIEGAPESGQIVGNVTCKGLTFSHSEWYFPDGSATRKDEQIGGFSQAAIGVPAAVTAVSAHSCRFEQCTFAHLGTYALELGRACQSNVVTRCQFSDLGAGGLKIGETAIREKREDLAVGNVVSDCSIHDGGRVFHSAVGIWIGQSPGNELTHNLIHDFYYTGISIGWTWGYGPSCASNNLVAFNHVHHIGVRSDGDGPILSDMGGIYTLGKEPGTRIVNNLWHDIAGIHYGGWGIYFDEGSSGILAQSNLVYGTTHGGLHQHYGETNLVLNNIFALARDHQIQRSRAEPHVSFTFETNVVYFDTGILLGSTWSDDQFKMDYNVYWDARAKPGATNAINFAGASIEKWHERGHDQHSVMEDPLFVSPGEHNFSLTRESPALHLGFQPLDLRTVGPIAPPPK